MAAGASGEGRGSGEADGRDGQGLRYDSHGGGPSGPGYDGRSSVPGDHAGSGQGISSQGGPPRGERPGLANAEPGGETGSAKGKGAVWLAGSTAAVSPPARLVTPDGCRLQAPVSAAEWEAYHLIREDVFRDSGEAGFRRSDEDEDRMPGHFPLLLWSNDEPVGTIRVDVLEGDRAALRLVAVHPSRQARGHGARMLHLAEVFARDLGCRTTVVYSTLEAAGFYAREGYAEDPWDDCCIGGIVQMSKHL